MRTVRRRQARILQHLNFRGLRKVTAVPAILALAAGLITVPQANAADTPSETENVAITEGTVTWGTKASWRNYVPKDLTHLTNVTRNDDGEFVWKIREGQYNPASKSTHLELDGSVQFQFYQRADNTYILDVTMKDLIIDITPEKQVISANYMGSTRENPGEIVDQGRIELATLDINAVDPVSEDGKTVWDKIPTSNKGWNLYPKGIPLDPVTISYTGPGGKPVLDSALGLQEPGKRLYKESDIARTNIGEFFAFRSQELLAAGGKSLIVGAAAPGQNPRSKTGVDATIVAVDTKNLTKTSEVSIKYRGALLLASDGNDTIYYVGFDPESKKRMLSRIPLNEGILGTPEKLFDLGDQVGRLLKWDRTRSKLILVTSSADDYENGHLRLIDPAAPSFGDEPFAIQPNYDELNDPSLKRLPLDQYNNFLVMDDGSYISCPSTADYLTTDWKTEVMPPFYVNIYESWGRAATKFLLDLTPGPLVSDPPRGRGYNSCGRLPGGGKLFAGGAVYEDAVLPWGTSFDVTVENYRPKVTKLADYPMPEGQSQETASVATDPTLGLVYAATRFSNEVFVYQDAKIVGVAKLSGDPLIIPPGGMFPVGDGDLIGVANPDRSGTLQVWKLDYLGQTATFATQPVDTTADLGAGTHAEVTFTSAVADASADSTYRWQVKKAGTSTFVDVPEATNANLTVDATEEDNGNVYRVIFSDSVGNIASDEVTLTVIFQPRFVANPVSVETSADSSPEFNASVEAHPTASLIWQRYDQSSGLWINIANDDSNFTVMGSDNSTIIKINSTNADMAGTKLRVKASNDAGTAFSRVAVVGVEQPYEIPADGVDVAGVSFDWAFSGEAQIKSPAGPANYLSAGVSDGTEATYKAVDGDVSIVIVDPANPGEVTAPTFATKGDFIAEGKKQHVRLTGGKGHINADGSGELAYTGAFSLNFYGGLVPFTMSNPKITIDSDGNGVMTADLSGYGSTQENPLEKTPVEPAVNQTILTFSNVQLSPQGQLTVNPNYEGIKVEIPAGDTQQNRDIAGWGSWPQEMVDFQLKTGLKSYWYTTGEADPAVKAPKPFVVDFTKAAIVEDPTTTPKPTELPTTSNPPTSTTSNPSTTPEPTPTPTPVPLPRSPRGSGSVETIGGGDVFDTLAVVASIVSVTASIMGIWAALANNPHGPLASQVLPLLPGGLKH